MASRGHDVIVLTDENKDFPSPENINGVRVYRLSAYRRLFEDETKIRWEQMYFGLLGEVDEVLRNHPLDLLHANSLDTAILGAVLSEHLRIPLVCTYHEMEPEDDPFGRGKCGFVFRYVPAYFIAGSRFYYDKAVQLGALEKKLRVIYHGVDLSRFGTRNSDASKRYLDVDPSEPLVVCVSRLKRRKGLLELVNALKLVHMVNPHVNTVIAGTASSGSSSYESELEQAIRLQGLQDRVRIRKDLTLDHMPVVYSAADVVVQPSFKEGLGIAVLEAMACERSVVATETSGFDEFLVDGFNALLVIPGDVEGLSETIIRILTDCDLREQLASNARMTVEKHFNLDRTVEMTSDLYVSLLDTGEGR